MEDDRRQPRHKEKSANVLFLARQLAFMDGGVEKAYDVLETQVMQHDSSVFTRREWQEAALTLLSLHDGDSAERWRASNLLPLPSAASRVAVQKMDSVMYSYCMLYWVKLARADITGRGASSLLPESASETLRFVLTDICCARLASAPRCLPTWRLLERVLNELLLMGDESGSVNDNADGSLAADTVRRMVCYLRRYIIRYLEVRDRPMEGRCGFLRYRGVFDRQPRGMNGGDCDAADTTTSCTEESCACFSARDVCGALQRLCACGGTCVSFSAPGADGLNDDGDGTATTTTTTTGMTLEVFLNKYFFQSAPVAFDRPCTLQEQ